jgi:hypothetical protein
MPSIHRCELPQGALLGKYEHEGAYADCYVAEVAWRVSHAEYVEAFYTTALFRVERLLLSWLVSKPSTDVEASQLAAGILNSFAAWSVEVRSANQLLLSDFHGRTRSWLMVASSESSALEATRLYFGSAVVPIVSAKSGTRTLGRGFRMLLGFHKLYSRALLFAAKSGLSRTRILAGESRHGVDLSLNAVVPRVAAHTRGPPVGDTLGRLPTPRRLVLEMRIRDFRPTDRSGCLGLFDSNLPEYFQATERDPFAEFLESPRGPSVCSRWIRRALSDAAVGTSMAP